MKIVLVQPSSFHTWEALNCGYLASPLKANGFPDVTFYTGFFDTDEALLDLQWAVNARGPYLVTQAVARRMAARGGGDVVNVLDVGGALNAWRHYSAYCMTKAALASLTRCLGLELAPAIRVNGVAPGTVLPPEGLSPETMEGLRQRIPQQRFGSPEDIVEAVLFFLTGPKFITGQILAVDGGRAVDASGP